MDMHYAGARMRKSLATRTYRIPVSTLHFQGPTSYDRAGTPQ